MNDSTIKLFKTVIIIISFILLVLSFFFTFKFQGEQGIKGSTGLKGPTGQQILNSENTRMIFSFSNSMNFEIKTNVIYQFTLLSQNIDIQIDDQNWLDGSFLTFIIKGNNASIIISSLCKDLVCNGENSILLMYDKQNNLIPFFIQFDVQNQLTVILTKFKNVVFTFPTINNF